MGTFTEFVVGVYFLMKLIGIFLVLGVTAVVCLFVVKDLKINDKTKKGKEDGKR